MLQLSFQHIVAGNISAVNAGETEAFVLHDAFLRQYFVEPEHFLDGRWNKADAAYEMVVVRLSGNGFYLSAHTLLVLEGAELYLGEAEFRSQERQIGIEGSDVVVGVVLTGHQQHAAHPHLAGDDAQDGLTLGKVAF